MSLPETIRVRITSENAESIGLSPVVVQEMALAELVRQMLGVTGKDSGRVREILARGSLVAGASRLRWEGLEALESDVAALFTRYPDPDPTLPFDAARCVMAVFHSRSRQLTIERSAGEKRRLLRRSSFWDAFMKLAVTPSYQSFSYRENADVYRVTLNAGALEALRSAAGLLAYSSYEAQLRTAAITFVDLYVTRSGRP